MLVPANTRTAIEATDLVLAGIVAFALTALFYAAFAGQGIDLADEGFLLLDPTLAGELDEMPRLFSIHVPPEERYVFMAPSFSAFYPILGKLSPVREIYFLPENMFQNTFPVVWRFLLDHRERIPTPRLFPNHYLLRRRVGV